MLTNMTKPEFCSKKMPQLKGRLHKKKNESYFLITMYISLTKFS